MTPAQEQALWEWAVAKAKQETEWGADSLYDFARARLLGALSVSGEAPPPEKGPRLCGCRAEWRECCPECTRKQYATTESMEERVRRVKTKLAQDQFNLNAAPPKGATRPADAVSLESPHDVPQVRSRRYDNDV